MNTSLDIRVFKYLSWILLVLVIAAIGLFFYAQITGDDLVLPWHINTTYLPKPLFIEYFQAGGESIGFHIDQYINWQQYNTGDMRFLGWPSWILLVSILISLWFICTAVTYFSRFWYFLAVGTLILIIIQMNLAELQLWGDFGTYIALGILILSTYFFNAIRPSSSLSLRFMVIGTAIALYLILVSLFAEASQPGLVFIANGLIAPIILAVLFILFVAGENIHIVLKVATAKGGSGRNNLLHFLTFGIIYNAVIILFFLNRRGEIDFELNILSPHIVLILSAFAAFYSFDLRFEKQKGLLPISLLKRAVYPALFIVTIALLAFAELTANDPLVDGFEYAIIMSHLAIGSTYFVSAFINFTPLILQNLNVYKVFYKPKMAPMFLINLVSLVFVTALLFYVNFYPLYQFRSGKYNALGDLSEKLDQTILAEQYYKRAVTMDFVNFKSNFQVANYEKEKGNAAEAILSIQRTYFKNASGKGYTFLSNYYNSKDQFFNSLFLLKQGRKEIDSHELTNNLAFTYRQFNKYDSAYLMLKQNWDRKGNEVTKSNLLALNTELTSHYGSDSLLISLSSSQTRTMSNALALANQSGRAMDLEFELAADSLLLQDELFFLLNASLNNFQKADSTKINVLDYYLANPYNMALRPILMQAKAIQLYHLGQINQAFQQLELLKYIDEQNQSNYNFMLGIWSLHQNQRLLSNDYLQTALSQGFSSEEISRVQDAVLSSEIAKYNNPSQEWYEQLEVTNDTTAALGLLELVARSNAFDEETTLNSLNKMSDLGASAIRVYEILVEAHQINRYSVPIFQAYILAAVEAGVSKYALEGLAELAPLMPLEAFQNFKKYAEQKIEERRNQLFRE